MVAEKPIVSHNNGFNKVLFSSVDIFFKKWSKKDCNEATLNTCLHGAEVPAAESANSGFLSSKPMSFLSLALYALIILPMSINKAGTCSVE